MRFQLKGAFYDFIKHIIKNMRCDYIKEKDWNFKSTRLYWHIYIQFWKHAPNGRCRVEFGERIELIYSVSLRKHGFAWFRQAAIKFRSILKSAIIIHFSPICSWNYVKKTNFPLRLNNKNWFKNFFFEIPFIYSKNRKRYIQSASLWDKKRKRRRKMNKIYVPSTSYSSDVSAHKYYIKP